MQVNFAVSSAHAYIVIIRIECCENESVVVFSDQYLWCLMCLTIKVSYPFLYSEVYVEW